MFFIETSLLLSMYFASPNYLRTGFRLLSFEELKRFIVAPFGVTRVGGYRRAPGTWRRAGDVARAG